MRETGGGILGLTKLANGTDFVGEGSRSVMYLDFTEESVWSFSLFGLLGVLGP